MEKVFFITQSLQVIVDQFYNGASVKANHCIDAVICVQDVRLKSRFHLCKMPNTGLRESDRNQTNPPQQVQVRLYIFGAAGGQGAIEFTHLQQVLNHVQVNYKGIAEVLGGAYLNGFFEKEF